MILRVKKLFAKIINNFWYFSDNSHENPIVQQIIDLSLYINFMLAMIKLTASILTGSLSIMSSLIDSAVDLVSGFVTW